MIRRAAFALALSAAGALLSASPRPAYAQDCADPRCEALVSAACLQRVGAGALPASDACAAENAAYVACLRQVAERCSGAAPQTGGAGCTAEDARLEWERLRDSADIAALEVLGQFCADTLQGRLAAARAEQLKAAPARSAPAAAAARPPEDVDPRYDNSPSDRIVGAVGDLRITDARDCFVPETQTFRMGAWRMQMARTASTLFDSRYLAFAAEDASDRFSFVGIEVLEKSNGWFRYRPADGVSQAVGRTGNARLQNAAVKTTPDLQRAERACRHYRWGRFDVELSADEILIAYDGRDNLYENEVIRLKPGDASGFDFRNKRFELQ